MTQHVLLLSVDGLHQSDLDSYVRNHPGSALASLVHSGTSYTEALTTAPSDSFPGMAAQVTGGGPATTGVYYDVSYNRALLAPGTTHCAGVQPGTAVAYDETLDKDPTRIDAGQGLTGLPGSILSMTGNPRQVIDPAKLPVDPVTCKPVYPHSYLKTNTTFDVLHAAGLRTAWSDKHAAYDLLNGPSGNGVDDFFTPEINSDAPGGGDWTTNNANTQQYDGYKAQAVINEINGLDHSGKHHLGVPALFGMNFQSVSTAQKLPTSNGMTGGYSAPNVPGPLLSNALDFVNSRIGAMESALRKSGMASSTTIILSAKHGQSPTDPAQLTRIDDGAIIDAVNAAWAKTHPANTKLITFSSDDDGMLIWLSDRSAAARTFASGWLMNHAATGNTITKTARTLQHSGLNSVVSGEKFFKVSAAEPRHPDLVGISQVGVVYTGGTTKIAEHGGMNAQDRHVPLVVARADGSGRQHTFGQQVLTTQIAPTTLRLLGFSPRALQAVRIEGTRTLPGTR
ncbi:alkaline phosphatase family protein [Calidifontibacter terrae]